ncbi:uncharacterized protein LOC124930728 [Impatiens glandulifera]|uniref:uncharacterized protein LOC124930728 n=1 Tax=Impatiens glandulifera TaxID=253017 RepID=UPI001FB16EE1|nr:uncharacterized protein LOC124930728 [Impatiens glandulifera]
MARTAFLRPNRLRAELRQSSPIRPCRNPNPNSYQSRYQKRSPAESLDRSWLHGGTMVVKLPSKDLVMGQVKILKRGEKLESGEEEFVSCLDPETETTQNQIKVFESDMIYAGSIGILSSPPPSSLPLPTFLSKKSSRLGLL